MTKYEKPAIIKLESGVMNKFGNRSLYARQIRKDIDGVSLDALIEKYGSPLFVFSEKQLRKQFSDLKNMFSTRYPNVTFGWSYKTNYLQAICGVMHQKGAIAEVVSEFEYEKARKFGIPGDRIIFNGPFKPMPILEKAARENAMIQIDHLDECFDLEQVAEKLGRTIRVGLRVNMDTGIHPQWSRFGFNLENGQAMDVVQRMVSGGKLELAGLHCHIGTFIMEPEAYGQQVSKMVKFGYEIQDKLNIKLDYYNFGGGLPSKIKLKGTYLPPEVGIPPTDEFAEHICSALYSSLRPGDFPQVYLETGRGIVDEAGYLISTILATKRLPDGRKAYIADAGVNSLFTSFWYKYNIETDTEVTGMNEPSVIYGPLCMNIDVIDEGSLLPSLPRGTRLILSPVGAYNVTQWMQFIQYRPNVVLITEDGKAEVIREAETLEDIEAREVLPERLEYQGS